MNQLLYKINYRDCLQQFHEYIQMKKNIFGTDGMRGALGSEPFTITSLTKLGISLAQWISAQGISSPRILIGHDTRESCTFVKTALQSGLLLHGAHIYDASIIPTPTLYALVKHTNLFDSGIIISASHNPYHDNGIKLIKAITGKINAHDEEEITRLFYAQEQPPFTYKNFGQITQWPQAEDIYVDFLLNHITQLSLHGKKIVLDCAHGATYRLAERIFKNYGAQVIVINNTPTGKNINDGCGALHLAPLQKAVIEHHADIGFAFDGDGDRVIAVAPDGTIKNGDDILALLLWHPRYAHEQTIVGTIMTNQGFAVYLRHHNKNLIRTQVGDKYISECLDKENMLIGGEQSGHIILRDYMSTGDGIFTALRVLEALEHSQNWALHTFAKFPQILINIPVANKRDLAQHPLATLIAEYEAQLHDGRLIVRYSGTESLLRVMVEDEDLINAQHIGTQLSQKLAQELSHS